MSWYDWLAVIYCGGIAVFGFHAWGWLRGFERGRQMEREIQAHRKAAEQEKWDRMADRMQERVMAKLERIERKRPRWN